MGLLDRFRRRTAKADEGAPPAEGERFRCADLVGVPLDGGDEFLRVRNEGPAHVVPAFLASALRRCKTFDTLAGHSEHIGGDLDLDPVTRDTLRAHLEELASLGLLVGHRELHERALASAGASEGASVARFAVVTRDRARTLGRCLESYADTAVRHGRDVELAVFDDSTGETGEATRRAASDVAARSGRSIRYAGLAEKRGHVEALSGGRGTERLPREDLEFALLDPEDCGRTCGANRNAALLDGAGEPLFLADDDTVGRVAPRPGRVPGLALVQRDTTEFWFFEAREEAIAAAPFEDVDPFAVHEELLGRSLAGCVAALAPSGGLDLDLDDAPPRMLADLARGRVLVTSTGIVGDSGMGSTVHYLRLRGPSRERLLASYETFRTTRDVLRGVARHTVSASTFLMAPAVALDARTLLPPFFPVLRNSDGIFAAALCAIHEDGYVGHVPWMTLHEPPETRRVTFEGVERTVSTVRLDDLVIACIAACPFGPGARSPEARLRALGRHLGEVGSLPLGDFEEIVRLQRSRQMSAFVGRLEETLRVHGEEPPEWADDVRDVLEAVRQGLARPDYSTPVDIARGRGAAEARRLAQRLVLRYGRLCGLWPEVLEAARRLHERGVRLTAALASCSS